MLLEKKEKKIQKQWCLNIYNNDWNYIENYNVAKSFVNIS